VPPPPIGPILVEPTVSTAPTATAIALPQQPTPTMVSSYANITPAQLQTMMQNKDFLLINTHAPYGIEIAHTDLHIPVDNDGHWLTRYPEDRNAKMVLYCRSGQWSSLAASELVKAGYAQVWHLAGGMVAWHAAGLPLQVE